MTTLNEWGVTLHRKRDTLLLGGGWFDPNTGWPKRFKTRTQAREAATYLTNKNAYWGAGKFRAVRLRITVQVEGRA